MVTQILGLFVYMYNSNILLVFNLLYNTSEKK